MFSKAERLKEILLVDGYIRDNCKWNVPVLLKKLFMGYYDELFKWKLVGTQLDQLQNDKDKEHKTTRFTVKGASFYAKLKHVDFGERGWNRSTLHFGFEIDRIDPDIESMVIYFELKCLETNVDYKSILRIDADDETQDDIYWDEDTANLYSRQLERLINDTTKSLDQLTFTYYVKPLRIVYKDTNIPDLNHNVEIKKRCEFTLNLNETDIGNMLDKSYYGLNGKKYYFPNPNGYNWLIYLKETAGSIYSWDNEWSLGVLLLGLPSDFDKMSFEITAYGNGRKLNAVNTRTRHTLGYVDDEYVEIEIGGAVIKKSDLRKKRPITLKVCLNIRSAETKEGNEVPKLELSKYGIV